VDTLLRAMPRIRAARPEAVLVVAGEGPERHALAALADALGVASAVSWLGPRDDVAALYRACDVFVLPSREEACSLALLEAMAAGAPIVATAVGGTPELARADLDASLVSPDDPDALAATAIALLRDRRRANALGASARRRVLSRFTLDRMVRETVRVYEQLLAQATPAITPR
jgi:glycosyltransferase involved in cell wall biosynthesis